MVRILLAQQQAHNNTTQHHTHNTTQHRTTPTTPHKNATPHRTTQHQNKTTQHITIKEENNYANVDFVLLVSPIRRNHKQRPKGFWLEVENRKEFLYNLAEELKFDPHVAKNWENITIEDIQRRKVCIIYYANYFLVNLLSSS